MAGSVVQTGSEPEPDPIELDLKVWSGVWGVPPGLTSVQFGVLVFHSKNRMEPNYGNTSQIDHGTQLEYASLGPTLDAQLMYQQHPYYPTEPQDFSN